MTIEEVMMYAIWFTGLVLMQAIMIIFMVWVLRKRQIWPLIMFGLKGGTLVLKAHIDNTIEILNVRKPIDGVKWTVRDKLTGKKKDIVQPLTKVHHTLKGTSYPIHFCPFTFPTNINILNKESAEINTEEINSLMAKEYVQGAADATSFNRLGGFPIDKATLLMLFIVGILMVALIAINLQAMSAINAPSA